MPGRDESRIAILPEEVVNKIAAGEVVVRPVNAVKELIENCLDAGATEITVSIQNGGLDLISVKVCARHATSKLEKYEDLQQMATYGFRGEAMASISYVSRVSIVSKTADDKCAHKASFQEGAMIEDSLSNSAGRNGTTITAEQLFYNCPSRRHALKYTTEEANRIADLLVKYSIHNPHVSFAFRRLDSHSCDFRTDGRGDRHSTIRDLLLHLRSKTGTNRNLIDFEFRDDRLHFCFNCCMATPITTFTSTAIQSKKDKQKIFHLFINDRLVECDSMKKSIDLVFSSKDLMCPFITISLQIDSKYVDVNVHPTKSTVHFLNEDAIIERIEQEIFQLVTGYQEKGVIEVGRAAVSAADAINREQRRGFNVHAAAKTPLIQQPSPQISNSQDWLMQPQTWDLSNPKHKNYGTTPRPASKSNTPRNPVNRPADTHFNQVRTGRTPTSNNQCSSPINSDAHSKRPLLTVNKASPATPSNSCQRIRTEASNRSLDEFVSPNRFSFGDCPIATSGLSSPAVQGPVHLVPLNLSSSVGEQVAMTFSDDELMDIKDKVPCSLSQYDSRQHQKRQISRTFELDALDELRRTICSNCDQELMDLFRQHSFIGFFAQQFGVFQSKEAAYVFHVSTALREFFYQLVIFSFGNMGSYRLHPSLNASSIQSEQGSNENGCVEQFSDDMISVRELLSLHFDDEIESVEIDKLVEGLLSNAAMLWDYFSIEIVNDESCQSQPSVESAESAPSPFLRSLPCVLDGYSPPLENLPEFVYGLANINVNDEQKCYEEVAKVLANLHTPIVLSFSQNEEESTADEQAQDEFRLELLRRLIFPAFKSKFLPSVCLRNTVHQIASIEEAFKKFGRC